MLIRMALTWIVVVSMVVQDFQHLVGTLLGTLLFSFFIWILMIIIASVTIPLGFRRML